MIKQTLTVIFVQLFLLQLQVHAQSVESQSFQLVGKNQRCPILISKNDAKVVQIAAELFVGDIHTITGQNPDIKYKAPKKANQIVLAGTLGKNPWIDQLVIDGKADVTSIKGKWESWSVQLIENPLKGVEKALVIIGSDRRGTAYGILELSRMMGVSPWEWWADVHPDKKTQITLDIENKTYGSPSVKYRGLFLNDEDWGLQPWAAKVYEPETGDIGPKTYAKIFELLLRLRANTIWPAMHSSTKPFYSYPKNKQVADDYAIVIGTSHPEPMLINVNTEWDQETMGEYRYDTNSETIKKMFIKRVNETGRYENIYTTGMRGKHDSPMIVGDHDINFQVKLLEQVITDQREILKQADNNKSLESIPQVFIPYKEVLNYYQHGMELPEDITLMWTDDNYGYIRRLSDPGEQKRSGGAGVYYHTSYWGRPHDYLWLNSTNPVLLWEEMSKAYQFNARNIWILNCGDIKPHEYNIELFMDMGWNMKDFGKSVDVRKHMKNWYERLFGKNNASQLTELFYEYYRLAFIRRPEFMAWSQVEPVTKVRPSEMSQIHYGDEVGKRIMTYNNLIKKVDSISPKVPSNRNSAFYELVTYPVKSAAYMNLKWLHANKNWFTAQQGRASALYHGKHAVMAYNEIAQLTEYFNNSLENGKWRHIMNRSPRNLPVFKEPVIATPSIKEEPVIGIALKGYEMELNHRVNNSHANVLPVFNAYTQPQYYLDIFLKGKGEKYWEVTPKTDWIKLSKSYGKLDTDHPEERIYVDLDWNKVPQGTGIKEPPLGHDHQLIPPGYKVDGAIDISTKDTAITLGVLAYNPKFEDLLKFEGFVEDQGYVSIDAENFTDHKQTKETSWKIIEGLGYTGSVVKTMPEKANSIEETSEIITNSPVLEYDFYTFNHGAAETFVQIVPTHAVYPGKKVRLAVGIDDAMPVILDYQTHGRSEEWKQNVLKNAAVKSVTDIIEKPGKHKLKIWMVDPGVMVDRILIDLGGWKESYAFPEQTMIKHEK
ncbi:glycosyl hydrolase 115 family protein [Galbibacter sp. EGI 63066]|uniref:glycosyl hydrolase 115 family protein n=1 Tax=Galbibacter sp. EGI 63066 TaxID=2993559 RepID=UPI0022488540|nr:glycosyl hydrolase 115 family protein [Galbibacter sp. EGI 63066]MCX2678642.1 glycosyl hydrolase 115 family protein [Galbibacter sp. EGI 63066]